jgi:hypothetical protein
MMGAGDIDLELGAIAAEDRPMSRRIEIVGMTAHIRNRAAGEHGNIDSAFIISVDQDGVRIRRFL